MTPAEQVVKALRVLLMVERDGRVVCVTRSVGFDPAEILWGQKWLDDSGFYLWEPAYHAAKSAARWWLVEAESAEQARRYIADRYMDDAPSYRAECASHILASGGKS